MEPIQSLISRDACTNAITNIELTKSSEALWVVWWIVSDDLYQYIVYKAYTHIYKYKNPHDIYIDLDSEQAAAGGGKQVIKSSCLQPPGHQVKR